VVRTRLAPRRPARAVAHGTASPRLEPTPAGILRLQRAAGNRAAIALLARAPATAQAAPALKNGAHGREVGRLQAQLNQLDEVDTALEVDDKYGRHTEAAVREFQRAHPPLKPTGAADGETRAAIEAAAREPQEPRPVGRKLFGLGAAAYGRRQFGHAYAFTTRAADYVDLPEITFSRAQALRMLGGRRDEAIALYEAYLASGHGKRDADAKSFIAALRTPEKSGDAKADVDAARTIFNHGAELYKAGDYAHAADEFERAAALVDMPEITFSRAQAVRMTGGRRQEAIELYEAYLASGHGKRDADAKLFLQKLRADPTGDDKADLEGARKAFEHGAELYAAGDFAHAVDEFERASALHHAPEISFTLAQALRRLGGREDEARMLYAEYLDSGHGKRDADAEFLLELLRDEGAAP
jgi:tetratricopeptide (TPR) repeat protein